MNATTSCPTNLASGGSLRADMCSMRCFRRAILLAMLAAAVPATGCAMFESDVTYNPYAPNGTDHPALREAQRFLDYPFRAMDRFDARFERVVY